ncbi:MAG: hypothetical protein HDT37_07140 [Clostridiales bacterium]|nr:hypothetical protein [Clostridiales bacterium]
MSEQKNLELDAEQRRKGHFFVKEVLFQITNYVAAAVKYANHEAKLTDEVFWKNLFLIGGRGEAIMKEWDGNNPRKCPECPYEKLDIQAYNKYLLYGGERELPDGKGFASDSLNFFKTFQVGIRTGKRGCRYPKAPYEDVLRESIKLRNRKAHDGSEEVDGITRESIENDLNLLEQLTAPIQRKTGWTPDWKDPLEPLEAYWERIEARCRDMFGYPPISLEELGRELFLSEDGLTPQQTQALEEAADFLRLSCQNGMVYEEDRQVLKEKLSWSPSVAALLGKKPAATQGEAAERAQKRPAAKKTSRQHEKRLLRPLRSHRDAAALLQRTGTMLPPRESVLSAILDCFTLLVDESMFLSAEGRELLNERLAPLLARRHEKLLVDESVVAGLFSAFRGSAPYTALELAELDPDMAEELSDQRQKAHKNSKTAIKTLRFLRQRKCLEVVFSPTSSTRSYVNIRQVAEDYPENRFLALTMDRQLAGELKEFPNAAAAKPCVDGELLLYRDTRASYLAMLTEDKSEPEAPPPPSGRAPEASAPQEPRPRQAESAPPVLAQGGSSKTLLSMKKQPKTGSRVTAELPDGSRQELILGSPVGSAGGEGTVYAVSRRNRAVVKIYHQDQLTEERREKLRHMTAASPDIPGLCWPQALVFTSGGEWAGYLMPKAEARELCQTVYKPGRNNRNIMALGWTRKSLALIAANIAGAFAQMHEKGILMGDVNPRNFMVAPNCAVYFVDCDSYQFGGFPCPVRSDRYTPPEVLKEVRRSGQENYNYLRTLDHERYSMAVVLFEVLMLGKSPYESRSTDSDNVLDAIIAGNFPYPFRAGEEEGYTDQTPVGRWREIWSHMTYQVKSAFHSTFTGKGRLSAGEWEGILREYVRQIELVHSSDELTPEGFKDIDGTMLDKVCSECGKSYNIDEATYRRRSDREPDLCPTHRIMYRNFRERKYTIPCDVCGTPFETLVSIWRERTWKGLPMLCPDCANAQTACSRCGSSYTISRDWLEELRSRNIRPLCPSCLDYERPLVSCEGPDCRETFRTGRDKLERLRRFGKPVLCPKCLNAWR